MKKFTAFCCFTMFAGLAVQVSGQRKQPLRLVQTIPIPNIHGHIGHMDADVEGKRLFVPALASDSLEVVDLAAGKHIRSIPGFKTPAGAWYVRELNKLFVASRGDGMVRVFRGDTLDLIDSIKLELGPNRLIYDPASGHLYVGYGADFAGFAYGRVGIIDVRSDKLLGDIIVEGYHPSDILLDNTTGRIIVSNALGARVDEFNPKDRQLVLTWPARGKNANDIGLDQTHRRVFVGTRKPPEMTVYDSDSGQEVAYFPTVENMDGVYYDARLRRVYVSGGTDDGGSVYVYQQKDADDYELIGKIPTRPNANTSHWVPGLNQYFVAAPANDKQEATILVFEPQP